MSDVWEFAPPKDSATTYSDGTSVPHRAWQVLLNGVKVGEAEVHLHKRRGPDGKLDISFGFTAVVFGPPPGGK